MSKQAKVKLKATRMLTDAFIDKVSKRIETIINRIVEELDGKSLNEISPEELAKMLKTIGDVYRVIKPIEAHGHQEAIAEFMSDLLKQAGVLVSPTSTGKIIDADSVIPVIDTSKPIKLESIIDDE